jgi:diaminopimelate decarboxylase
MSINVVKVQIVSYVLTAANCLSFHVGSGVQDPKAYVPILHQSKKVFDIANSLGLDLNVLDIGGGFPGHQGSLKHFEAVCRYSMYIIHI